MSIGLAYSLTTGAQKESAENMQKVRFHLLQLFISTNTFFAPNQIFMIQVCKMLSLGIDQQKKETNNSIPTFIFATWSVNCASNKSL